MTELTVRDLRANLKHYLDRAALGETFTLRGSSLHLSSDESCAEHVALDREEAQLTAEAAE